MRVGVLCALPGGAEADLVAAIDHPGTGLRVVRRCADLAEVVALAIAGVGRVVALGSGLPGADRSAIARLRSAGCRILLLAAPDDVARCRSLGADAVLPADTSPTDVVRALRDVVRDVEDAPEPPAEVGRDRVAPPRSEAGRTSDPPAQVEAPSADGRLIAVWGPHGAPGRTTIAVNLAAELAAGGRSTLLVDADTWGGCIAQVLGLLDESPGLAAAARAAANGRLDAAALSKLCPVVAPGLRVLTGLARPDRWRELAPTGLDVVWETARLLAEWTVVDCGFSIEDEAGTGFEAMLGPRRNGATLSALAAADVVLAVGSAEPVGIQRLVQGLTDFRDLGATPPDQRLVVVVNRLRPSAAGPRPERAVTEALVRYAGVPDAVLVPDDRAAVDRAVLNGTTLRSSAPGSPARAAIEALAVSLAAGPAPSGATQDGRMRRRRGRSGRPAERRWQRRSQLVGIAT